MKLDKNALMKIEQIFKSINLPCDTFDIVSGNSVVFYFCDEGFLKTISGIEKELPKGSVIKLYNYEEDTISIMVNFSDMDEFILNGFLSYLFTECGAKNV